MTNQDQKPAITLAQWCAYLPYGLEVQSDYLQKGFKTKLVVYNHTNSLENGFTISDMQHYQAKPLLRPMNRANEGTINEIAELLGYKFSSLYGFSLRDHSKHDDIHIPIDEMPYYIIQKLLTAHYDIFNLVPQGLALPIE